MQERRLIHKSGIVVRGGAVQRHVDQLQQGLFFDAVTAVVEEAEAADVGGRDDGDKSDGCGFEKGEVVPGKD
jgi:hypothetical protein